MTPGFAEQLRAAGNDLPAVAALYAPLMATQDRSGVVRHVDLPYGSHPRHRLDVYQPAGLGPAPGHERPLVVFLHGGGFIRGSKEHRENLGVFFAQHGYVALLPNYRLAPESRWPCGPEDVIAVWQWAQHHAAAFGGDAARTVLMGESAGAAHVAAASLRTEFHPASWHIAGAVLLSGPYNARLEGLSRRQFGIATPDPRNEPYFGSTPAAWDEGSTVDHVTAAPFPLLISYTELDLPQMQVQAGELFARLTSRHGFDPELLVLPRHNHFSQGYSVGTRDTSLSDPLLRFLDAITQFTQR